MEGDPQDDQWELIAPLLPAHNTRGRPRADDRRTLNGILWVLRSGARWKDLPKEYGSCSTCHRRFQEWQDQGVWEQIWLTFLGVLDQQGSWIGAKLSWMAALYRLKRGGDIAYGWKEKGSTVHLVTEGNDLALAFVVNRG
jgi:transposase